MLAASSGILAVVKARTVGPVDPARSALMTRVRGKNTRPELIVRRIAHSLGFRFRLHRKNLPGSPDLVFPRHRNGIFVHGCFWHHHSGCPKASIPKTGVEFWKSKFSANIRRDARSIAALREMRWKVCVLWECETSDRPTIERKLKSFLIGRRNFRRASSADRRIFRYSYTGGLGDPSEIP
jgi:DNA mismatch endonuclease, patch repair protein